LLKQHREMLERAKALGETGDGFNLIGHVPEAAESFLRLLSDFAAGQNLSDGLVQQTTLFLVRSDGRLLGETRLRHELTESLRIEGGHVGYFIHPDHRGLGYGREILRLSLLQLRRLKVENVLVTCNANNYRSRRVILANGGQFAYQSTVLTSGQPVDAFWIRVDPLPNA
jgi:predicted acetyltransferase